MNETKIKKAMILAQMFISRSEVVLYDDNTKKHKTFIDGNAKTGALRRSSMELTRALASLRKAD